MNAWFVIGLQVFTVPHQVNVPPSLETLPRFHDTRLGPFDTTAYGPCWPTYVTDPSDTPATAFGTVSHTTVLADTRGLNISKLLYES